MFIRRKNVANQTPKHQLPNPQKKGYIGATINIYAFKFISSFCEIIIRFLVHINPKQCSKTPQSGGWGASKK
jgi:hypothetical protein